MSKKELKRIMNDKWPEKQPCDIEEFKKLMKKAAKLKIFDFEDIENNRRRCSV